MTTFGFSAYLKLIHLNPKPQRREVRQRVYPSENGYDFHRSLRGLASRLLHDREPLDVVRAAAEQIARDPERRSAKAGIDRLNAWLASNPVSISTAENLMFESPSSVFKVRFTSDFGAKIDGKSIGVHIWNTANPELNVEVVSGALAMFAEALEKSDLDEIAVLSLRNNTLYRVRDIERYRVLAAVIAQRVERVFSDVRGGDDRPGMDDRLPLR